MADATLGLEAPARFDTPGVRTIEDLATGYDAPADRQIKTLIYVLDGALPSGAEDAWLSIALVWVDWNGDDADAVYAAEELEEAAKLFLMLRGQSPRLLTAPQVNDLLERFG